MEAILKFNLPEEAIEHLRCVKADSLYLSLWELDQYLREQIKYHEKNELQVVRDRLSGILFENGVGLDELAI